MTVVRKYIELHSEVCGGCYFRRERRVLTVVQEKISVLNPLGQPPPIKLEPMAPRLETLAGKTVYVVDVKFPNSRTFAEELMRALKETHPGTNWIYREKAGSYFDDDPPLWAEIKANGHGMVQLTGH